MLYYVCFPLNFSGMEGFSLDNHRAWAMARDRLTDAVVSLGYPAEFAQLMATQLGSPRAIDRMCSYVYQARPASIEMMVDEMLSIRDEIAAWREKKESQAAQAAYNTILFNGGFAADEDTTDD